MARLTPLAVSVLALLAERASHAYELYQLILRRREDRVIDVSAGSLYRVVERLADAGYIAQCGVERSGHRPERTVYAITPAGSEALQSALSTMISEYVNEYPRFPVAIREARNLPPSMVARLLRDRKVDIASAIQFMDDAVARVSAKGLERHLVLDLHFTRAMLLAESEWIAQTITELDSGALTWPTSPITASPLLAQHPEALDQLGIT